MSAVPPREPRASAPEPDAPTLPGPAPAPAPVPAAPAKPTRVVAGPARLGRRTKVLVKHLSPGDIAVIDHKDLDRVSAEDLIAAGVSGVLNCRRSSSDIYPNMGPLLLVQAGVHLVDLPHTRLFDALRDGDVTQIAGGEIRRDGDVLATGTVQQPDEVRARNDDA